ncbi:MAG: hypothetical protein KBE04_15345 [Phycisphaerae bacterium]|nr:hypothetical protein [Phycisphaerae bacterium]
MTADQKLETMLQDLGRRGMEPPPAGLADRIKQQIPIRLAPSRWGRETIHIMVHLRISRVAAAAAIVLSLVLFASLFGRGTSSGAGWAQEIKGAIADILSRRQVGGLSVAQVVQDLASNGVDVVYYEQNANAQDPTLILMFWKLPEGDYRVVFTNGRVILASAEQLIRLQSNVIRAMGQ